MRDPSGQTARDVVAGRLETSARAGESGAPPTPALRARARDTVGSEAAQTSRCLGGRVPQILGRIARSPGGVFGKDHQAITKEGNEIEAMCPVCLANAALIAAGATSSGGLTAFAMRKFCRKKQTHRTKGIENETSRKRNESRDRVGS